MIFKEKTNVCGIGYLLIADLVIVGFNCYCLIKLFYDAMENHDQENYKKFVEILDFHCDIGFGFRKISMNELNSKLKDNLLSDQIIEYEELQQHTLNGLISLNSVEVKDIFDLYDKILEIGYEGFDHVDYVLAYNWLHFLIKNYHKNDKKNYDHLICRYDHLRKSLTYKDVNDLAIKIHEDFMAIKKKNWFSNLIKR